MVSATIYPEQQEVSEPHISASGAILTEQAKATSYLPAELLYHNETDRRGGQRQSAQIEALLYPMGGSAPVRCQCSDIGAGGLHVTAPIGYGLAVGQRYELVAEHRRQSGGAPSAVCALGYRELAEVGRYVTVVRTEMHVNGENDSIGAALRFDQPLAI